MHPVHLPRVALVALLFACDQAAPTEPQGRDLVVDGPSLSLSLTSDADAILRAAGIEILEPADGESGATGGVRFGADRALLAFSAIKRGDGTVIGEYEYRQATPDGELRIHGKVTCLATKPSETGGGDAVFGGPVTHADLPPFHLLPPEVGFAVSDLGEGANAQKPDQASRPGDVCKSAPMETVQEGNIQVH